MFYDKTEDALLVVNTGIGLSLTQVHTLLAIILLSIQLFIFLTRAIFKIVKGIKTKNLAVILEETKNIENELQEFTDKIDDIADKKEDK